MNIWTTPRGNFGRNWVPWERRWLSRWLKGAREGSEIKESVGKFVGVQTVHSGTETLPPPRIFSMDEISIESAEKQRVYGFALEADGDNGCVLCYVVSAPECIEEVF